MFSITIYRTYTDYGLYNISRNYVVQHILGLRVPRITSNILRQLKGHFATLSCNKYGSNVVEKCLSESNGEQSTQIVLELLSSPNFCMVLVDPYGNFVIQAALSVSIDRYSKRVLDKHPSQVRSRAMN